MRMPENRYCDPHCSWLRVAIWEAYNHKDYYNGDVISFREMEIDHIVAQDLYKTPNKLKDRLKELGLNPDFPKDDLLNFVPTRGGTNVEKYKLEGDQVILKALSTAKKNKETIKQKIDYFFRYANAIEVAAKIAANITSEEQRKDVIDIILHDIEDFREETFINQNYRFCGLPTQFVKATRNVRLVGCLPEFNNPMPSCNIEFRTLLLRGITLCIPGTEVLGSLCRGNHTPIDGRLRSYLHKDISDELYYWNLGNSSFKLGECESNELCEIIDDYAEAYIDALMNCERENDIEECCLVEGGIRLFRVRQSIYDCVYKFVANNPLCYQNVKMECSQNMLRVYSLNERLHFATRLENVKMPFWYNEPEFWIILQPYYTEHNTFMDREGLWSPSKVRKWLLENLFADAIRSSTERRRSNKIPERDGINKTIDAITAVYMDEILSSIRTLDKRIPGKITSEEELLDIVNILHSYFSLPNAKDYYGVERLEIYDMLLTLLEGLDLENTSYRYIASNLGNLEIHTKEEAIIFVEHLIGVQKEKRIYSANDIERVLRCVRECIERTSEELGFQTIQKMSLFLSGLIRVYNRNLLISKYLYIARDSNF